MLGAGFVVERDDVEQAAHPVFGGDVLGGLPFVPAVAAEEGVGGEQGVVDVQHQQQRVELERIQQGFVAGVGLDATDVGAAAAGGGGDGDYGCVAVAGLQCGCVHFVSVGVLHRCGCR